MTQTETVAGMVITYERWKNNDTVKEELIIHSKGNTICITEIDILFSIVHNMRSRMEGSNAV